MGRIIYIARAGLPIDAAGIRISCIGQIFRKLGYSVHYLCDRRVERVLLSSSYTRVLPFAFSMYQDYCLMDTDVHFINNEFVYSYLPPHPGTKFVSLMEVVEFFTARRAVKRIINFCETEHPDIVVFYNDGNFLAKRLSAYCRKNGITIIGDVTEWYEKRDTGSFIEKALIWFTDQRIRKCDKLLDGVISISPFFYSYYQSIGVRSVFIPPLMPISIAALPVKASSEDDIIRFVYAGSPGSKDIILPFVKAVIKINENAHRFRLDLVGLDISYVNKSGCLDASEKNGIYVHGRLSHEETVDIVRQADYGVLLRHDKRYAKAGFSTKFAECMSLGVAMICNRIGGTDMFVEDGVDGFLLDSTDEESLMALLKKISIYDRAEIHQMKENALEKASKLFNIDAYREKLNSFLEGI